MLARWGESASRAAFWRRCRGVAMQCRQRRRFWQQGGDREADGRAVNGRAVNGRNDNRDVDRVDRDRENR